jgi:hypothetical protein
MQQNGKYSLRTAGFSLASADVRGQRSREQHFVEDSIDSKDVNKGIFKYFTSKIV